MSRARPLEINGSTEWFDTKGNKPATPEQLEMLAAVENVPLDDILDEGLSQGQVLLRLRENIHGNLIPQEVLERRRARKLEAAREPSCRICSVNGWECEGEITRHHFIPRWLMRELENYHAYSARPRCTIPICIGRHRDLHMRNEGDKSIAQYLNKTERELAIKMLKDLQEEHPKIFGLLLGGSSKYSYEAQLISDFISGKLHVDSSGESATLDRVSRTG